METKDIIRIGSRREMAVLMVHGIVGTPLHFKDLMGIVPEDITLYNILLDGHGGNVEDFSHTSMTKWKAQVSNVLDGLLARHDRVLVVGHSMGTLFAIREAIRRPDKIAGLFLLNVPVRPFLSLRAALASFKLALGIAKETDRIAMEMQADSGVTLTPKLWKYIGWIPRFFELLQEAAVVRQQLGKISVPCQAYQSRLDELVSFRSCRDLEKHSIRLSVLNTSGHFAYSPEDTALLQSDFSEFLIKAEATNR